jgi:hypothetical protein
MIVPKIRKAEALAKLQEVINQTLPMAKFVVWLEGRQHKTLLGNGHGMFYRRDAPNFQTQLDQLRSAPSSASFDDDIDMLFTWIAAGAYYCTSQMTSLAEVLVSRHTERCQAAVDSGPAAGSSQLSCLSSQGKRKRVDDGE